MAGFDDNIDRELYDAIQERRKRRKDMERLDSEATDDNPLGKMALALASGLGGYASGRPGGEIATQVLGQRNQQAQQQRELRMKAISQSDDSIKALTELARIRSAERIANQKAEGKAGGKILPAESAVKLGNLIGAADASRRIEGLGAGMDTGKIASVGDWFKEALGLQDKGRAKALADIGTQRNEVMSRIAGANVTPEERGRIQEGIPTRTDAPDVFQGKSESTTDQIINKAEAEIAALKGSYDTSQLESQLAELKFKRDQDRRLKGMGKKDGLAFADSLPSIKVEGGKTYIRVGNGQETHYILPEDLQAAQRDGFQVIR